MFEIGPFTFSAVAAGEESELLVGIGNGGELLLDSSEFLFSVDHGVGCGFTVFGCFRSLGVMLYVNW